MERQCRISLALWHAQSGLACGVTPGLSDVARGVRVPLYSARRGVTGVWEVMCFECLSVGRIPVETENLEAFDETTDILSLEADHVVFEFPLGHDKEHRPGFPLPSPTAFGTVDSPTHIRLPGSDVIRGMRERDGGWGLFIFVVRAPEPEDRRVKRP